jgi:3-oxoadipate enol-lactonase
MDTSTSDKELHVAELGDPDRPSVVFLHGMGMGHRMWQPQLGMFAAQYHVVAPDLPGFAASASSGPSSLGGAAGLIADAVRRRCRPPVHLCGLSLGAIISLQIALDDPPLVRSLILSGAQVRPHPVLMVAQRLVLTCIPEKRLLTNLIDFVPKGETGLSAAAREDAQQTGKAGLLATMREMSKTNFRPRLHEIAMPVLVLCGAKDRWNLKAARELATAIPAAELKIVPEAGHAWNLEMPEIFNHTVLEFMQRVEKAE